MRLSDFILRDMEAILGEWEAFAATLLPAATGMTSLTLRDHAQQILEAVAADLLTEQSAEAQAEKSKGRATRIMDAPETAAQTHAVLRAQSGFDINQLAAEYRALRASVLRLWLEACAPGFPDLDELIRFNEAIDQAVAESVYFFSAKIEQARNLLLGMLGHDMRSPLQTIQMTATYLSLLNAGTHVSDAAERLIVSGARLKVFLDDLVDFNRTRLGLGIKIVRSETDLGKVFSDELNQLRGAHPAHQMELEMTGDLRGSWDGSRLQQLLDNLVWNAIKYGSADAPIRVVAIGGDETIRLEVKNNGLPIDPALLGQLFEPLKRGPEREPKNGSNGSLGLGLYIAREIATAHGGEIEARSDRTETVFTVTLPRLPDRFPEQTLAAPAS